jgi:Antirestriction protein
LLRSQDANAVLAVNGCAQERLRPFRPAPPIDRCAAAWIDVTGNPAQITTSTTLMNSFNDVTSQRIEAREVTNGERMQMLPRHFGRHMLTVENAVYTFMRRLAPQYAGGYWTYLKLSNSGFYLAPQSDTVFNICVEGNGFEGEMSADAAGITACLFALSHLSFQITDEDIANHFHYLREFALSHAEAGTILAAID